MNELASVLQTLIDHDMLRALLFAAAIMVVTAILAHFLTKLIRHLVSLDGVPLEESSILVNIGRATVWVLGVSIMLSGCFKVDVNALVAAMGVGGVALSLGMQDTLKNLIGGLQVTLTRILAPGDHVIIGGVEGIVQDVTWRQTVVLDYENIEHLIPNSIVNSTTVSQVSPKKLVSTVVVLNNDGRDVDAMLRHMEVLARDAVARVTPLERDPWMLVTQVGEYGVWVKMRFVLTETTYAREARDAALRAIAPYTRNDSREMLVPAELAPAEPGSLDPRPLAQAE